MDTRTLADYEPGRPLVPAPRLDEEWLTVLAPVRSRMARLEALQLEPLRSDPLPGFAGLTPYANRPDDPWQQAAVAENRARRARNEALQASRLIVGYGTPEVSDEPRVAVGSIDSWGESVPEPPHTTQAAFSFNAPGARAPQAIVVAVPPVLDHPWDTAALVEVLAETRELAHARTATVNDLGDLRAVLPLAMLSTPEPWGTAIVRRTPDLRF